MFLLLPPNTPATNDTKFLRLQIIFIVRELSKSYFVGEWGIRKLDSNWTYK